MKKLFTVILALMLSVLLLVSCNQSRDNAEKDTAVSESTVTTAHIHVEVSIPSVPATCNDTGLTEGAACSVCRAVLKEQKTVPALGHNYVDGICTGCNHKTTTGLEFSLINNGTAYEVSDNGSATDTEVCIPSTYKGLPVTSIGFLAFDSDEHIKRVELPNSITKIDDGAFSHCTGLTSINLPNSITSIGIDAFAYCESLKSIEIPNSVTSIGIYTFQFCSSLTSVKLPSNMTSIVDGMFDHCTAMTYITIPDGVKSIGVGAFMYCSDLKSIVLPSSVTVIGVDAFVSCGSLTSIIIPREVTSIGEYAFYRCYDLTSITFQGTKASWNSITKGHGWNFSTGEYTVRCDDGIVSK